MPKKKPLPGNQLVKRIDDSTISCDDLTKEICRLEKAADVTGLAIAIFNNNKTVYKKTFGLKRTKKKGLINPSTVFYGASLSKPVFSTLVMMLACEGLISLDIPLQNYLPKSSKKNKHEINWWSDFSELRDHPYLEKITARMCLSHTTGLPNWRWLEPENKLKFNFEPGKKYSYSGEGYCYLQSVLETITCKSLQKLAEERIFHPLGMTATAYKWMKDFNKNFCYGHSNPNEIFPIDKSAEERGASTLKTTLDDYSLFICAILNNSLLKPHTCKGMFSPQVSIQSKKQFGPLAFENTNNNNHINLSYGLGWGIFFTPCGYAVFKEGHGDGFAHYTILFPKKQIGMVALSNSFKAEGIFRELFLTAIGDSYSPWEWNNYIPYNI